MAAKTKTREITISDEGGAFQAFFKKLSGEHKEYDFQGLETLRKLLSNEKARLLHIIKTKKPISIYALAKISGRDFKSVNDDIKVLQKFGFIEFISEKTGRRERLKPVLSIDRIRIDFKI
ncbi:hypothetical protein J4217_02185 [Candidatus Pacearchaeota archaeon]|nr:hypothetical protein [Candidatus Pacearchaeota archaeon]